MTSTNKRDGGEVPCAECGMPCRPSEYHPYAACLMFKSCRNGHTVRENLAFVMERGADALAESRAEVERLQKIVRPKREEECLTLDHWRMRAYDLEANWSRCSRHCNQIAEERDHHKARAERLAEALRDARDYVTSELSREREAFKGHENCSDIPSIEADLAKIDAALNLEPTP